MRYKRKVFRCHTNSVSSKLGAISVSRQLTFDTTEQMIRRNKEDYSRVHTKNKNWTGKTATTLMKSDAIHLRRDYAESAANWLLVFPSLWQVRNVRNLESVYKKKRPWGVFLMQQQQRKERVYFVSDFHVVTHTRPSLQRQQRSSFFPPKFSSSSREFHMTQRLIEDRRWPQQRA